jgi:hypothetical protein
MDRGRDISGRDRRQGINGRSRPKINRDPEQGSWDRQKGDPSRQLLAISESQHICPASAQPRGGGTRISSSGPAWPAPKDAPMNADGPLSMLRPVLWLAAAAFAVGFGGYLAVAASAHGG